MQCSQMSNPKVTLPEGSIQGCCRKDINGEEFLCFEGIPYGEPPVGELRFKDPLPVRPWRSIKNCTKIGPTSLCKQPKILQDPNTGKMALKFVIEGSEDCLNLNVYTRQLGNSKIRPSAVMMFIHGGGFVFGSTKGYGAERLITQDVVLVQIHYRLGVFGFLAIDDPDLGITGNAAMKDMVLALKWIKKNISLFNGDPENVTIIGHSAGGASAAYLALSPLASGLFHKGIIQSCCALNNSTRGCGSNAKELAKLLSCKETDSRVILRFLQSLPAEKLYEGELKLNDIAQPCSFRMFSPTVEPEGTKDPFLKEDPVELLRSGKYNQVPIMLGYAEMESILFMDFNEECPFNAICFGEDILTPSWFGFEKGSQEFQDIAKKITEFYYGGQKPEYISLPTVQMFSDISIIRGVIKTAKHLAETSDEPIFLYRFSIPKHHAEKYSLKNLKGATHGDELPYLFKMDNNNNEEFERISLKLVKLWTNFVKFGNPTAKKDEDVLFDWKPITKDHSNYLDIGQEILMKEDPEADRMNFWDTLYQSYEHTKYY